MVQQVKNRYIIFRNIAENTPAPAPVGLAFQIVMPPWKKPTACSNIYPLVTCLSLEIVHHLAVPSVWSVPSYLVHCIAFPLFSKHQERLSSKQILIWIHSFAADKQRMKIREFYVNPPSPNIIPFANDCFTNEWDHKYCCNEIQTFPHLSIHS